MFQQCGQSRQLRDIRRPAKVRVGGARCRARWRRRAAGTWNGIPRGRNSATEATISCGCGWSCMDQLRGCPVSNRHQIESPFPTRAARSPRVRRSDRIPETRAAFPRTSRPAQRAEDFPPTDRRKNRPRRLPLHSREQIHEFAKAANDLLHRAEAPGIDAEPAESSIGFSHMASSQSRTAAHAVPPHDQIAVAEVPMHEARALGRVGNSLSASGTPARTRAAASRSHDRRPAIRRAAPEA